MMGLIFVGIICFAVGFMLGGDIERERHGAVRPKTPPPPPNRG